MLVDIALLYRRDDARGLDSSVVQSLRESMAHVGQLNPIRVRPCRRTHMGQPRDAYEVILGNHRWAAARELDWQQMEATVCSDDDMHAELAMIDENLCRAELSPSDRARQTARRKAIYEQLHPETKAGVAGAIARHAAEDNLSTASFTDATAEATGRDPRSVRRDAERGAKVIDEVLDMVRGTKLDTGAYLDKLKALSPNDQVQAARRDLANLRSQERAKPDEISKSRQARVDSDVKQRAAREVAEMIAERFPSDLWDAVKANLYAAGASNIAHELTNITGQSIMDQRYA